MATISEAVYFCAHFAQSSVKGGQEYDEQNGKQGVRTGNRSGHPHGPKRGPSAGAAEALSPAGCGQGRHPADGCGAGAVVPAAGRPDAGRDIPLSGRCLPLPGGTSGGSGGGGDHRHGHGGCAGYAAGASGGEEAGSSRPSGRRHPEGCPAAAGLSSGGDRQPHERQFRLHPGHTDRLRRHERAGAAGR